jgi:hypothetical protein
MGSIFCKNCGAHLDEASIPILHKRSPCPQCGSKLRLFKKHIAATLTVRGGIRGVAYSLSKTKWFAKFMSEPSFTWKLGIWSHRLKVENKRSDQYLEVVTNPENGEILHECAEPLSEHQGHGSAKSKSSGPR